MSFIASSALWGEEACARLCKVVMEANDGMAQQIMENRTDLLDLLPRSKLVEVDDFGLTLTYLAIYYDRPDMLKYLHKRGVNLGDPCDPMGFGNAMFYAVNMGKNNIVETLHYLGYSVNSICDTFLRYKPDYYANRTDNSVLYDRIRFLQQAETKAKELFKKNMLRKIYQSRFMKKLKAIQVIQKYARKYLIDDHIYHYNHKSAAASRDKKQDNDDKSITSVKSNKSNRSNKSNNKGNTAAADNSDNNHQPVQQIIDQDNNNIDDNQSLHSNNNNNDDISVVSNATKD